VSLARDHITIEMSQRLRTSKNKKRRGITYLWILCLAVLTFLLIYFEQTSLLYILATFGVTVLLIVVALADLGQSELSPDTMQTSNAPAPSSKTRN
jgi:membrane protein YdbS with pleckstrin-like domain